jgi:hypothetical protein
MVDQANNDRRIVVGVDGSECSKAALRWALTQARLIDATVEAVNAWQDPVMLGYSYGWAPAMFEGDSIPTITEKDPRRDSRGGGRPPGSARRGPHPGGPGPSGAGTAGGRDRRAVARGR